MEAFALEADFDAQAVVSNQFTIEYPPKSGIFRSYPEVDRAAWFGMSEARSLILPSQSPILDALERRLAGSGGGTV